MSRIGPHTGIAIFVVFLLVVIGWVITDVNGDTARNAARDASAKVAAQAHASAVAQRNAQVKGCNRSRRDRVDNARGWQLAAHARAESAKDETGRQSTIDRRSARRYTNIADKLESRIVNCKVAFPPVPPLQKKP